MVTIGSPRESTSAPTGLCRVQRLDEAQLTSLSALLVDAVQHGASVGFLAPLSAVEARHYWQDLQGQLGRHLRLWLLLDTQQGVVGTVQLALCPKANGAHRAEVQKLMVHSQHRGRGHAASLLAAAEAQALAEDRHLLVLDTESDSVAERVYQRLGWQQAGKVPDYALSPSGQMHPTTIYFKRLRQ